MSALDQVRDTFFQECEELLEELQEGLLAIGANAADGETIHAVFRAVHSIKGGAGAFGFDHLVKFAHEFESLLDAIRNERVDTSEQVVGTLLVACDTLGDLVVAARDETTVDVALTDPLITELLGFLPRSEGAVGDAGADAEPEFAPVTLAFDLDMGASETRDDGATPQVGDLADYVIRFKPHADLYRNGNEAAFLIRALAELGELKVICDTSAVPGMEAFDPGEAYLSWEILLQTDAAELAIREVFDFVEGACDLEIKTDRSNGDFSNLSSDEMAAVQDLSIDEENLGEVQMPETVEKSSAVAPSADIVPDENPKNVLPVPAKTDKSAIQKGPTATVRVDVNRIDRLINLVGELVMNQAMLAQCATDLSISVASDFASGLDELKQLSREIQDSVMAIRAQPVKSLFQRMSRIVREAAAATGKKVQLEISGEMTEVDKMVIEKLADPLTHMIRNAVDHGLEDADKRARVGKAEVGTVWLSAAHRSGRIIIDVTDDGGGINRQRVLEIAVEKGLISANDQLSDEEVDALLFRPGFSTVDTVSELSGRGVGMDVVSSAIRALSGRITIRSRPGEGSTFSVSLPLTLAVLDGMVVEVDKQMLVIPITAIIEMLRPDAGSVHTMSHESDVIFVRDTYVPVLDVGHILGIREKLEKPDDNVFVLIETDNGVRCAFVVDAIHDQRQVVIKGLEKNYGKVRGIAAATVLGDGRIALILDPNDEIFVGSGATTALNSSLGDTG